MDRRPLATSGQIHEVSEINRYVKVDIQDSPGNRNSSGGRDAGSCWW